MTRKRNKPSRETPGEGGSAEHLARLALSIADYRNDTDWPALEKSANSPKERVLIGDLMRLEKIARYYEACYASADLTPIAPSPALSRSQVPLPGGTTLGPYELVSELGSGGMGRVYLAEVLEATAGLGRGTHVAVKVIHSHLLDSPARIERVRREAKAGMTVRHTNVVRTYAVGEVNLGDSPCLYLVMEYVAGQSLRSMLTEIGRLPEELCLHIGREMANGLEAIHRAGVVHRDIKPENVLITTDQTVKVADLGVARVSDATVELSSTGDFLGSIRYAAPEQFMASSREVDARADLYSLGTVLYELATGRHPFQSGDIHTMVQQVVHEKPAPAGTLCPQLSAFLEQVLERLLAKQPRLRFESARQLIDVLASGESGTWWADRTQSLGSISAPALRRVRVPHTASFHGRHAELEQLLDRFADAKQGRGQLVLVEGEIGIGKTRLVDELESHLSQSDENFSFLFGSYPPAGGIGAEGPFTRAVRDFLGERALAEALKRYLKGVPRLVPGFLSSVLGEMAEAGIERLGPDAFATALVRFLQALAAERPTILVVDDLHFASPEGRALFAALGYALDGHRLLLIGISRPGAADQALSPLWRYNHCSRLPLPRLQESAVVSLLGDAISSETVASLLGPSIGKASDGNPYFVLEFARMLRDDGIVRPGADRQWAAAMLEDYRFPSSLHSLVQARLGSLSTADREILELASCCGHEFDPSLVAQAAGTGVMAGLRTLALIERRDRLVHSVGRRCVFDHHLVQAALYGDLAPHLREAYHAAIAEALEQRERTPAKDLAAGLPGSVAWELCEHFLKGRLPERAHPYLDPALRYLEAAQLKRTAGELARQALAIPALITGRKRIELLLQTSVWIGMGSERTMVLPMIDEALELAEAAEDLTMVARALLRRATALRTAAHGDEAEKDVQRALAIARELEDRGLLAEATSTLGVVMRNRGQLEEALAMHETAESLARELGQRRDVMRFSLATANTLLDLGREMESLRIHEACLAMTRELGESAFEALELGNLGSVLFQLRRFAEAKHYQEQHLELARAVGYRRGEMFASINLGVSARTVGRLAEARSCHERALLVARAIGDLMGEAIAQLQLGMDSLALGELDRAEGELHTALDLGEEIQAPGVIADTQRTLSALKRAWGRMDEAKTWADSALELCRTTGYARGTSAAKLELGRWMMSAGQKADAATLFSEVAAQATPGGDAMEILLAQAHLAALGRGAPEPVNDALDREQDRLPLSDALEIRHLLWTASGDGRHLRAANRILVELEDHAPPASRKCLIERVPIHREIRTALSKPPC